MVEIAKKKMGRPKTGRRDKYVCLPLNLSEKQMLEDYAKQLKTPVSTLMRTLIFQSLPPRQQESK
jgi:hypothetical protein